MATAVIWLERYCGARTRREWMSRVHAIDGYRVATDGRGILAVRDTVAQEASPLPCDRFGPYDRFGQENTAAAAALAGYLHAPLIDPQRTSLRSLLLWCGYVEADACDSCAGHGTFDGYGASHGQWEDGTNLCPDCNGTGRWWPSTEHSRPSRIAGAVVSRNRLAWMLAMELIDFGDAVTIGRHGHRKQDNTLAEAIIVEGECWRLVMMGLTEMKLPYAKPWGVLPTFHPEPVFAELWCDDEAGGLILADWLEEHGDPLAETVRYNALNREPTL